MENNIRDEVNEVVDQMIEKGWFEPDKRGYITALPRTTRAALDDSKLEDGFPRHFELTLYMSDEQDKLVFECLSDPSRKLEYPEKWEMYKVLFEKLVGQSVDCFTEGDDSLSVVFDDALTSTLGFSFTRKDGENLDMENLDFYKSHDMLEDGITWREVFDCHFSKTHEFISPVEYENTNYPKIVLDNGRLLRVRA